MGSSPRAGGRRAAQRSASGLAKAAVPDIDSQDIDPAFHRAILKIALELRRPGAEGYDEVVERTMSTLRLDGEAFRRYVGKGGARNMSLLLSAARRFGSSA